MSMSVMSLTENAVDSANVSCHNIFLLTYNIYFDTPAYSLIYRSCTAGAYTVFKVIAVGTVNLVRKASLAHRVTASRRFGPLNFQRAVDPATDV